jgi:hypothetical protein
VTVGTLVDVVDGHGHGRRRTAVFGLTRVLCDALVAHPSTSAMS